jgi:hypothetical protein
MQLEHIARVKTLPLTTGKQLWRLGLAREQPAQDGFGDHQAVICVWTLVLIVAACFAIDDVIVMMYSRKDNTRSGQSNMGCAERSFIEFPKLAAHDLPRTGFGQIGDKLNRTRHLISG